MSCWYLKSGVYQLKLQAQTADKMMMMSMQYIMCGSHALPILLHTSKHACSLAGCAQIQYVLHRKEGLQA